MPILRLTEEDIRPNTGDNGSYYNSSWFSTVRSHYARERRGEVNRTPTASDFMYEWRRLLGLNSNHAFEQEIALAESFSDAQFLADISACTIPGSGFTRNYPSHTSAYVQILAMFNIYAKCREHYRHRVHFKVDFLCQSSDSGIRANKWEAKFHGRCMFNIAATTYDDLKSHIENNRQMEAWAIIDVLYRQQRWLRQLANPRYLRNQPRTNAPQSVPTPPAHVARRHARASAPERVQRYESNTYLSREYLARQNENTDIISCAELGRMITNSNLPAPLRESLRELIVALRMTVPVSGESETDFVARLFQEIRIA